MGRTYSVDEMATNEHLAVDSTLPMVVTGPSTKRNASGIMMCIVRTSASVGWRGDKLAD